MMSSLYSSVSGLRAHQTKMDVIGNNIANVNTVGFRSSRVTFQEIFSQTLRAATAPDPVTGRGGSNPMQVGLGINVGSIDTNTNRGSLQRTDNITDLAINGNGFFIVKGSNADEFRFTRAGNFHVDEMGNLVTSDGMLVYGWLDYGGRMQDDGTFVFDVNKPVEPINIYYDSYNNNKKVTAAKATENISLSGNLNAASEVIDTDDDPQLIVPMLVYDSLGNEYEITMEFRKTQVSGTPPVTTWTWNINGGSLATTATGTIRFDAEGKIIYDPDNPDPEVTPSVTFQPGDTVGSASFQVTFDLRKLTMYSGIGNSVKPISNDGYPSGVLLSYSIGSDGMIIGVYSNGKQMPLGLIALAEFDNPAGLARGGSNTFVQTTNSGIFINGVKAGTGSAGTILSGTLEMSNVDLANQFTEMIVTQRGFQANSRILTTIDEMLQEVTNIKR
ncbi:MAG TPA: flagellar hook protein FlgE [Clostridiaceae bacterium]|nr:flagellar hook protein FlgE [Clostridiaceae bacterium]